MEEVDHSTPPVRAAWVAVEASGEAAWVVAEEALVVVVAVVALMVEAVGALMAAVAEANTNYCKRINSFLRESGRMPDV